MSCHLFPFFSHKALYAACQFFKNGHVGRWSASSWINIYHGVWGMAGWVLVMFSLSPACVNCVGALKEDRGPQYVNFKKFPSPVSLFFVITCTMKMLKKKVPCCMSNILCHVISFHFLAARPYVAC